MSLVLALLGSIAHELAQASPVSPPNGPLGWLPYVVAFVGAVFALRAMPSTSAKTVGETLGGMVDRLEVENRRERERAEKAEAALVLEQTAHDETRRLLRAMTQERDDLLAEQA